MLVRMKALREIYMVFSASSPFATCVGRSLFHSNLLDTAALHRNMGTLRRPPDVSLAPRTPHQTGFNFRLTEKVNRIAQNLNVVWRGLAASSIPDEVFPIQDMREEVG